MTILSIIRDVCATVGVVQPTSVFAGIAGNRTMTEMLSLANEVAQRIAYDTRDWNKLKKSVKYVATSGAVIDPDNPMTIGCSAFNLPADYKRMLLTSNVWRSTSGTTPMMLITDTDDWMNRRLGNWGNLTYGEWTMAGGQLLLHPALDTDQFIYFAYLHRNCVALASGGFGDSFINDLDGFALDERLLKLGMIWQWKALKGSPYAEDMGTYADALTNLMGADAPAPIIIGRKSRSTFPDVIFVGPTPP
jgi:hypothetical protein